MSFYKPDFQSPTKYGRNRKDVQRCVISRGLNYEFLTKDVTNIEFEQQTFYKCKSTMFTRLHILMSIFLIANSKIKSTKTVT